MTLSCIKQELESLVSEILKSSGMKKIYVQLCLHGPSTSEQIAEFTRLYPSTVRELLSKMTQEGYILRKKLEKKTVGKNPYIYEAVSLRKLADLHMSRIRIKVRIITDTGFKSENRQSQSAPTKAKGLPAKEMQNI